MFYPPFYPARNPWPPGIATAETIKAALGEGERALASLYGMISNTFSRALRELRFCRLDQ